MAESSITSKSTEILAHYRDDAAIRANAMAIKSELDISMSAMEKEALQAEIELVCSYCCGCGDMWGNS